MKVKALLPSTAFNRRLNRQITVNETIDAFSIVFNIKESMYTRKLNEKSLYEDKTSKIISHPLNLHSSLHVKMQDGCGQGVR